MTAATSVGAIYYEVEADTSKLLNAVKPADDSMQKLNKTFDRTDKAANSAQFQMTKTAAAVKSLGSESQGATSALGGFSKVLGGLVTLQGVKMLIDLAEGYGEMSERVRMATADATEYEMVQQRLLATANGTYRSLSEASEVYIRTADSLRAMGYSTSGAMDVVDSLSYLFVTNATSAQRADSAISAFTKSLNKGKVEGDAWESLLAAVPSIIGDIAAASGKSAEEIRQMGVAGDITSRMLTEGLAGSLEKNQDAASKMATNLKDAFRSFSNSLSVFLGEANNASGATGVLSSAIIVLGNNIDTIVKLLGAAGAGVMARYIFQTGAMAIANAKAALSALQIAQAQLGSAQAHAAATGATAANTAATTAEAAAAGRATSATVAQTGALVSLTTAKRAATAAGAALLSVLGGPVGIIALVASAAAGFVLFGTNAFNAAAKIDGLADSIDKLGKAQLDLRRLQASEALVKLEQNAREAGTAVQSLERDYEALQKMASQGRGVDDSGLANVQKSLVEQRAAQEAANEELQRGYDIQKKISDELEKRAKGGSSTAGNAPSSMPADPEVAKRLAGMRDELELAKLTGVARARLAAIQQLGANATDKERKEAEQLAVQIFQLESARKGATKSTKASVEAEKENAKVLNELAEALLQTGLSGEQLAAAKARASLNKFATPEDIKTAEDLAVAAFRYNEQLRAREKLGKTPEDRDKYIKGDVSPLSGGAFDDQYARYEAEAVAEQERYAAQQKRLQEALEVQEYTREQYAVREQEFARTHADRMAQIEQAKSQTLLRSGEQVFGEIASVMRSSQGEQSSVYRAMFAASKAFAIAQASLNFSTALSQAMADPTAVTLTQKLANWAAVAAAGASVMSALSGASMGGGRQYGGPVAPGAMHRINENGKPEIYNAANGKQFLLPNSRGEVVSNKDATSGSAPAPKVTVNIHNAPAGTRVEQRALGDREYILDVMIEDAVGGGRYSETNDAIYGRTRRGR